MGIENWLLIVAAIAPAIVLGGYIFKKDRVEKEPLSLLALIFAMGVFSCFPAIILEEIGEGLILGFMGDSIKVTEDGIYSIGTGSYYIYQALTAFLGVALIEEFCKWFAMKGVTAKHKEFDNIFDGVVYGSFAALGFATLENIMYVLNYGWGTAFTRAFLSVPGHLSYGVIMGYYYSLWKIAEKANSLEKNLKIQGKIPMHAKEISYKKFAWLSVIVPTFYHGAYDLCCFLGNEAATYTMVGLVIFLYIYCFGKIKKMSRADGLIRNYYINVILEKYPGLSADVEASDKEILREIIEKA